LSSDAQAAVIASKAKRIFRIVVLRPLLSAIDRPSRSNDRSNTHDAASGASALVRASGSLAVSGRRADPRIS
jgi:hypothetical protein